MQRSEGAVASINSVLLFAATIAMSGLRQRAGAGADAPLFTTCADARGGSAANTENALGWCEISVRI